MSALALGLVAAVCWGFHDICVRFLSQKTPISACIITVLTTGLIFHLGLMTFTGGFQPIESDAIWLSIVAGVLFVIATFGLYAAFQRGPVRVVAPLIAGYPILSVAWAVWMGTEISALQWLAVLAIIIGVAVVAALSDTSTDETPSLGPTIFYSLIAAAGFSGTFIAGQWAADLSHDMPSTLVTRVLAVALTVLILIVTKQSFLPDRKALPWLIAMGCADGIALWCVLSSGTLPNAQYAAVTSSMFGLLTILLAWVLLKERMTLPQWGGCVVAFAGVGYLAL